MVRHLDLFSGIGGFAYAADTVFGEVEHIFCDNEPFARAVLKKHWPEAQIYGDIRKITTNPYDTGLERKDNPGTARKPGAGKHVDILTGGFPCQPFSAAGLRRGTADERHLWPEMLRVIRLTQPSWVIAENVYGLLDWNDGLVFEQVCTDLEAAGYEVQPFVIPAVAVNAPHRRYRVWFVGHAQHHGLNGAEDPEGRGKGDDRNPAGADELRQLKGTDSLRPAATDPGRQHGGQGYGEGAQQDEPHRHQEAVQDKRHSWDRDWSEVAARLCSLDDGLPARLGGLELSKPRHRKEQLKAYGNAIVPQVAMEIMQAIKEAQHAI